ADDEQTGTFLISDIQNLNSNIQFAFSVDASNEYEIVSFNSPARYGDKLVSLVYDANLCTTTLTLGNSTNDVNAPTGVSGLSASQQGMAVTFDWMPATDDIGIAGYQVEFDGDRYLTSGTSFLVLGYAPGSHSYRVRAYDTNLNYSEWSSGSISIVEPKDRKVVLYKSSVLQNADEAFVGVAMGEKENYDSMVISSGGKAISTILHRGAQQDVLAGGVASNTHMQAEWYTFEEEVELWEKPEQHQILQNVMSGGTAIGTVLAGPSKSHDELEEEEYWDLAGIVSGTQVILDGGVALSTTLKEGAQIISGGLAIMTEIDGGVQSVMCGSALSTVLLSGSAYVGNGGTALSANVRNGIIAVDNSGIAIGTVISSGATMLLTGGREENTTLMSGGSICVSAGVLNDFTLASGQVLTLGPNGGTASNLTLEEGGIFDLGYFGGAALYVTGNHKYGSFSVVSGVGSNLLAASGCRISTNGGSMIHPIVEKGGTISLTGSAYATDVELREGALFVFNAISGA
ncbi:MAG: hypothetical protein II877_10260, partial [Synergistaceae bacterium]|nr:hypothetical protein [Synergistaceae bacterium]